MSSTSERRPCVVVRGSINVDEYFSVDHIAQPGETISSSNYSRRAGGKGANQAVAAAKAGANSTLVANIGQDGTWLLDTLSDFGVDTKGITVSQEVPTGRALIQLSKDDNSIVLFKGANFATTQDTTRDFGTATHLLLQNEIPFDVITQWTDSAHRKGLVTIFNPSPMPERDEVENFPWTALDWLIVNEGEARQVAELHDTLIAKQSAPPASFEFEGARRSEVEALGQLALLAFTAFNFRGVVMTLGPRGSVAVIDTARVEHDSGGSRELMTIHTPAGQVVGPVKNTTGAGDCFAGFFAAVLAQTSFNHGQPTVENVRDALVVASQASAMCVEKDGAMESVPSILEVRERMLQFDKRWPL
ncbi:putative ribokinase [Microbotryomycetes sp. JL201]|nr:putative ribokinase [Microbotryomycetes sp. JL201]